MRVFLRGLGYVLFTVAGLLFFWGGRAISEFAKVDRLLAEIEGIALSAALGILGYFAENAGRPHRDTEGQDSSTWE